MDREIDNILDNLEKKKKVKSGLKGKRVELELVKDLNTRFKKLLAKNPDWGGFSRSIGSGNRWGQKVHLSKAAKETYSGDLVVPANFKFSIESKGGYNDIDLCSVFNGGSKELDGFLEQAAGDSKDVGKKPMLIWKKDRKPRLVFIYTKDVPKKQLSSNYLMIYRDWTVVAWEDLAKLTDDYFFDI